MQGGLTIVGGSRGILEAPSDDDEIETQLRGCIPRVRCLRLSSPNVKRKAEG